MILYLCFDFFLLLYVLNIFPTFSSQLWYIIDHILNYKFFITLYLMTTLVVLSGCSVIYFKPISYCWSWIVLGQLLAIQLPCLDQLHFLFQDPLETCLCHFKGKCVQECAVGFCWVEFKWHQPVEILFIQGKKCNNWVIYLINWIKISSPSISPFKIYMFWTSHK